MNPYEPDSKWIPTQPKRSSAAITTKTTSPPITLRPDLPIPHLQFGVVGALSALQCSLETLLQLLVALLGLLFGQGDVQPCLPLLDRERSRKGLSSSHLPQTRRPTSPSLNSNGLLQLPI